MSFLIVWNELQHTAEKELNKIPIKIQENLDLIRKWVIEQPHLNARTDDQSLLNFLRVNEHNVEKAKEEIDLFYTCKTLTPELFSNRDPLLPEIQEVLNRRMIAILSKPQSPAGPRLIIFRAELADPERVSVLNFVKCLFMVLDILSSEDSNISIAGISYIVDLKGMSYRYVTQIIPSSLKKIATCLLFAYPIRLKSIYFINTPYFFRVIYNVFKIFLDEKLIERMHIYGKLEDCRHNIERSLLPKDYGGEHATCDEISDELKFKVESYRDWLLNDEQFCSKETKRIIKPKTSKNIFGRIKS